jgi:hypothetical protein
MPEVFDRKAAKTQDAANARQGVEPFVTGQLSGGLQNRFFNPRHASIQLLNVFLLHRGHEAIGRMLVKRLGLPPAPYF